MEITPATQSSSTSAAQQAQTKLTGDFQSFLTLLTTQLKHQDPLEPVDSTEFTSQLAQFAAVEQGIATNANLEKLIASNMTSQALGAVGYLGKEIAAKGNEAALKGGTAHFAYELASNADSVAIGITNEAGITVLVTPGAPSAGRHDFAWDGKDSQGLDLPEGKYKITVTAADADGKPVNVQTYTVGTVDGADSSGETVNLTINGVSVPLADVVTVKDPPAG